MTAVECVLKSGPYRCQVSAGGLPSEPLTGKKSSVGFRATCTIQFTAAQTDTSKTVATMIRTANGAPPKVTIARPASRQTAERRARWRRPRVARGSERGIGAYGMTGFPSSMPNPRSSSPFPVPFRIPQPLSHLHQNVLRLDVGMENAGRVRGREAVGHARQGSAICRQVGRVADLRFDDVTSEGGRLVRGASERCESPTHRQCPIPFFLRK